MKRFFLFILTASLVFASCAAASAGWNPLNVAAEGKGIAVYTSSGGGKQAGVLYRP